MEVAFFFGQWWRWLWRRRKHLFGPCICFLGFALSMQAVSLDPKRKTKKIDQKYKTGNKRDKIMDTLKYDHSPNTSKLSLLLTLYHLLHILFIFFLFFSFSNCIHSTCPLNIFQKDPMNPPIFSVWYRLRTSFFIYLFLESNNPDIVTGWLVFSVALNGLVWMLFFFKKKTFSFICTNKQKLDVVNWKLKINLK